MFPSTRTVLPILATLIAMSGCSNTTSGEPLPTSEPTATSGGSPSLDVVDPCTLLTAAEVGQFGANAGKPVNSSRARACQWLVPGGNGVFSINLRSGQGLADIVVAQGKLADQRVGSHSGKILRDDDGPGACMISIEITKSSRVDVQSSYKTDTAMACDRATKVTNLIEPRLPRGE
jgi:Protein of unknown function (DUF3558)